MRSTHRLHVAVLKIVLALIALAEPKCGALLVLVDSINELALSFRSYPMARTSRRPRAVLSGGRARDGGRRSPTPASVDRSLD